ncbi:hypothetical protein [Gluconobacter japonicus]|uniref:hypothetical protein n=1 Tax=Gluconobacter japonicus TaxID=376620 RepID=UPI0007848754|nr:hypothetical protein [Gluconobacter japonicus]KXV19816.1 hypothetical protein AD935_15005 [Gluconobacter japonicus]
MSLSPVLRSHSAYIRYRYAQNHLEKLREQLRLEEKLDNFDFNSIAGDSSKKIVRFKKHPDVLLSLILGDFIHSLRSSLDYVACALVTLSNPEADLKRVQFPFGRIGVRLNRDDKGSVKGISEEALEAIERARAQYGEGLSLLCDFSNQDKHRFLMPAYSHLVPCKFAVDERTPNSTTMSVQPKEGHEKLPPIRDGGIVDFSDGTLITIKIGFQLEAGGVSYRSESIDRINEAVRQTLNELLPLTQSLKPTQGVHP